MVSCRVDRGFVANGSGDAADLGPGGLVIRSPRRRRGGGLTQSRRGVLKGLRLSAPLVSPSPVTRLRAGVAKLLLASAGSTAEKEGPHSQLGNSRNHSP